MTEHTHKPAEVNASSTPIADHAEQRRRLLKKLAAGAFGAPVVLASLGVKPAAASL